VRGPSIKEMHTDPFLNMIVAKDRDLALSLQRKMEARAAASEEKEQK
jgi:hypothetical protein